MIENQPAGTVAATGSTGPWRRDEVLLELSNTVVRLHKQYYGKGPRSALSQLANDVVTVVLEGGFTRHEETLLEHDHAEEVADARAALQQVAGPALRAAVEELLQRRVRSFMSANDPVARMQVEVFVLEPAPEAAG